jgi:4a-hydroxytetrahydrobiopterin dehydratase
VLGALEGWSQLDEKRGRGSQIQDEEAEEPIVALQKTWEFGDFAAAMVWVNRVAELAEEAAHHPDILIRYNRVTLTLWTHTARGLTEKDALLAEALDDLSPQPED